jgi:hypothetical protein
VPIYDKAAKENDGIGAIPTSLIELMEGRHGGEIDFEVSDEPVDV